ncbi:MAG: FKBP-type peptidyl-prolyl cis-trans isomerase [Bacteroides sp.]|nr:FKBP-type peptidyl-prolyl cis-trans isomerase [Bacteroides sp.]MCM1085275.1 FKBP-type peptidyl-prolyl cis-trans isomerase [Bacteroides sp.]
MSHCPDLRHADARSRLLILCLAVLAALSCACKRTVVAVTPDDTAAKARQEMLSAQEIAIHQELEGIEAFLQRSGWQMQRSGSGLYYSIEAAPNPNAPSVERGDAVRLSYTLRLLNGEEIASSEKNGLKTFIVGKSETEPGLTEAVLMMRKGDRARLILPSRLGFGFSGNGAEIPPMASLLYELCVEEVLVRPEQMAEN